MEWKGRISGSSKTDAGERCDRVNAEYEGRTYHKLRDRGPVQWHDICCYFPAARTVVVADEECVRGLIRQPIDSRPDPGRAGGWQPISRGLVAAAWDQDGPDFRFDEVSGMLMELLVAIIPLNSERPRRSFHGLDDGDLFRITSTAGFRDAREASRAALEAIGSLAGTRVGLAALSWTKSGQEIDASGGLFRSMLDLARNGQVRCNGRAVEIASRSRMSLADFEGYFGGRAEPVEDRKRADR